MPNDLCSVGTNRYATSAAVAQAYFPASYGLINGIVGFASGASYADALAGDPDIGARVGPLLLVPPTGPLPAPEQSYLQGVATLGTGVDPRGIIFGGTAAVGPQVATEIATVLG